MNEKKPPGTTPLTIMGVLTIFLGIVAIAAPAVAGKAVVIVIGVVLLVVGIGQIIGGLRSEGWSHKLPPLILGIIAMLGGLGVLGHDLLSLSFLTLMLAIFFSVEGIWKIIASFSYRPASGWLAILVSGVATLILGVLIFNEWPSSAVWAVGILVGVDLLMTGISMVALASTIRRLRSAAEDTEAA